MYEIARRPSDEEIDRAIERVFEGDLDERRILDLAETLQVVPHPPEPLQLFERLERLFKNHPAVLGARARFVLDNWVINRNLCRVSTLARACPFHPYARAWRAAALLDGTLDEQARGERDLRAVIREDPSAVYPRCVLSEALRLGGRANECLEMLDARDQRPTVIESCAFTWLGVDRLSEASALVEAYQRRCSPDPSAWMALAARVRHELALQAPTEVALEAAWRMTEIMREDPDDGRLDHWEHELFLARVRLGRLDEALAWAERVAKRAPDLARLANTALLLDREPLARELSRRAFAIDSNDGIASLVRERLKEVDGDASAWLCFRTLGGTLLETERARMAMGEGDSARALLHANAACEGHAAFDFDASLVMRAQAKLLCGDIASAREDALRAFRRSRAVGRRLPIAEVEATFLLAQGAVARASRAFQARIRCAVTSDLDRKRILRLLNVRVPARRIFKSRARVVGEPLPAHQSTFVARFL